MNKKIFAGILCLVSVLSFCSCGDDKEFDVDFGYVGDFRGTYSGDDFYLYIDSSRIDGATAVIKKFDQNNFEVSVTGIPENKSEALIASEWAKDGHTYYVKSCEYVSESGETYNCSITTYNYSALDRQYIKIYLTSK